MGIKKTAAKDSEENEGLLIGKEENIIFVL